MAYFGFTKAIFEGAPIQVFNHGNLERDFTYIDDIVSGVVSVASAPPSESRGTLPAVEPGQSSNPLSSVILLPPLRA